MWLLWRGVALRSYKAFQSAAVGKDSPTLQSLARSLSESMDHRFLLALFLVLLVTGKEAQGVEQGETDSPALLESISSYWDSAKAVAQNLYKKTYLSDMDEKLRDMYSKSSAAMSTYAGIVTDQLFTLLKGD